VLIEEALKLAEQMDEATHNAFMRGPMLDALGEWFSQVLKERFHDLPIANHPMLARIWAVKLLADFWQCALASNVYQTDILEERQDRMYSAFEQFFGQNVRQPDYECAPIEEKQLSYIRDIMHNVRDSLDNSAAGLQASALEYMKLQLAVQALDGKYSDDAQAQWFRATDQWMRMTALNFGLLCKCAVSSLLWFFYILH